MISSVSSYDDELLNSAYANISLIADEAWTFDREDPYRKLNYSLWIQCCEVIVKYEENGDFRPRLVRDVISESRLAKYGNYEYDEQREKMYKPDDDKPSNELRHFHPAEATEPWMVPEVQEHIARLISPDCTRVHREPSALPIPKCNVARRENEIACSNFQPSNWMEGSKKLRHQRINPKESRKAALHGESFTTRKLNEGEIATRLSEPREKSTRTFAHRRYTVETVAEMQLQSRIESDVVRDIWNPERYHQQYQQCYQTQSQHQSRIVRQTPSVQPAAQHHQQYYCTFQYPSLILKTEYQRRSALQPPPVLSAEVPEFFPKLNPPPITYLDSDKERNRAYQLRYFPSMNNRSYQSELFPYNRSQQETTTVFPNARMSVLPVTETNVFRSSQQWIQRVAPPMQIQIASSSSPQTICASLQPIHDTAIAHCPLQMYEKFLPCTQPNPTAAIPVYQRPTDPYQESTPKRKSHGVDFNNLILLTKNSIKMRRGHSRGGVQQPFLLESKQSTLRSSSGQNTVQWHDKDCARRTKEVMTVNALVSELRSFEEKYEHGRAGNAWVAAAESPPRHRSASGNARSKNGVFGNENTRYRTSDAVERDNKRSKRLYRDVLANTSSCHGMALENVFERRYDELEQQAMEQYRNSEESLALKYQELERQAMEQYRDSSATEEKHIDLRSIPSDEQDCFDGQRCSGHRQCCLSEGDREKKSNKRSCFLQPGITLLKPKGKSLPNVFHGSSCKDTNQQTAIASRSLSTLTDRSLKKSKNISKGASGDKIDTNVSVRTSSKRRLILVSPFERKSEARLTKTANMREIYSLSQTRKNVLEYYQSSEIVQNGSGDENITIIQSPSTEVWLSGFWTT